MGPDFSDEYIKDTLVKQKINFTETDSESHLTKEVAKLLATENVVGWFQGKMEFGPRALGARSILGDPRSLEMQKNMNLKIKFIRRGKLIAKQKLR